MNYYYFYLDEPPYYKAATYYSLSHYLKERLVFSKIMHYSKGTKEKGVHNNTCDCTKCATGATKEHNSTPSKCPPK